MSANEMILLFAAGPIAIVIVAFGAYFFFTSRANANTRARIQTYTPAPAVIARVEDTGIMMSREPVAKLTLLVTPTDRSYFMTMVEQAFSPFDVHKLVPGAGAQVRFDPKNPNKAVFELAEDGKASVSEKDKQLASKIAQLEDYAQLRKNGVEAKAKVQTVTNLNVRVDNVSSVFHVTFDVTPSSGKDFPSETIVAVDDDSVHKLQPGKEMIVKYDPNNKSKLGLIHAAEKG